MTFFIITLGCPKNEVDSNQMAGMLIENGHLPAKTKRDADVIIVNTCGFIDTARKESVEAILKAAAGKRPNQKLIAAGCLAQRYPADLKKEIPQIDAIVGTRELDRIIEVVGKGKFAVLPNRPLVSGFSGASAYIKIADGCNASCGFCAIPMIKGPYKSKPQKQIIDEARLLVSAGKQELILIAQDTTSYGQDLGEKDGLPNLIEALLEAVPGLPWLRIMYAYPTHITDRLIELMAERPQICHYIDLPLQHAHPATLRRMKRPGNVDYIRGLISRLRTAMPDLAVRSSFIVGYPGETDEEFEALFSFMQEMRFDRVGVFLFSQEEGTFAAQQPDQIPQRIKRRRYARLMRMQQQISLERNRGFIGQEFAVILEAAENREGKLQALSTSHGLIDSPFSVGRSYRDAPEVDGLVFVKGVSQETAIVKATITEALEYDLLGELVSP